ncbi:MAG: glycosyltransferase N-terminal domain-containing protein [Pseudomonadota bacterium]
MIAPFLGAIFRRRAKSGKEDETRISERLAQDLPQRPDDHVIWFHAASVGESQIQLELARRLVQTRAYKGLCLFTCQTQTAAQMISDAIDTDAVLKSVPCIQQMAPVDTPTIARRFLDHWRPHLAIIAEGEIWPNLLIEMNTRGIGSVLVNARMTEKSILGWLRWRKTANAVFSTFDLLVAADVQTKTGLSELSGRDVICPGNLKSALPAPSVDPDELDRLVEDIGDRPVLLAASTHPGEEAIVLDAWLKMVPRPFLIIAPRHPDRGDEIDKLLSMAKVGISRRSEGDPLNAQTDVLLADTIGEMGLWYRLCDTVYLGGGHTPGIGGHNPLEALRLGKPVISGPSIFNFRDLSERLLPLQGFSIVHDVDEIIAAIPALPVSTEMSLMLEADSLGPMSTTLDALDPILAQAVGNT